MSEILTLEWAWIDFENRRVAWPDSKTGLHFQTDERGRAPAAFNAERIEFALRVPASMTPTFRCPLDTTTPGGESCSVRRCLTSVRMAFATVLPRTSRIPAYL